TGVSAPQQIIELVATSGERGQKGVSLRGDLALPLRIMEPDSALTCTDGSDERLSIRRHGNPFLFCSSGSYLLWNAVRKALTPDMETRSIVDRHVHPFAVVRPHSCGARSLRDADDTAW